MRNAIWEVKQLLTSVIVHPRVVIAESRDVDSGTDTAKDGFSMRHVKETFTDWKVRIPQASRHHPLMLIDSIRSTSSHNVSSLRLDRCSS